MDISQATDAQKAALRHVYDRAPLWRDPTQADLCKAIVRKPDGVRAMTFTEFQNLVQPGYGCLMVPWLGMWLGIETDGYTHS